MSVEEATQGVDSGQLVRGQLRVNAKNPSEAFVSVSGLRRDVAVVGQQRRGRGFEGDVVAIRLLHRDVQGSGRGRGRGQGGGRCRAEEQGEDVQLQGEVVCVLEAQHRRVHIGHLAPGDGGEGVHFVPHDVRYPRFRVSCGECPVEVLSQLDGAGGEMLLSAELLGWARGHRHRNNDGPAGDEDRGVMPEARLVGVVGQAGDVAAETNALLIQHGIDAAPFPQEVLDDLPEQAPEHIIAEQLLVRRDLRHERVYTIDPATAKDLDDAIHIKACGDGTYQIGVHIADVSFFVRAGSTIDAYAAARCTTTYLTQLCVPMLPHTLSEHACSLNPKEDRLAFTVLWRFSADGRLLPPPEQATRNCGPQRQRASDAGMGGLAGGGAEWIGRTVIRSKCRLAYETAQAVLDDGEAGVGGVWPAVSLPEEGLSQQQVAEDVRALHRVTSALRARRFGSGSVAITQPKVGFRLGEDGLPVQLVCSEQKEANQLVEELMLLANQTIAKVIAGAYPDRALLRRHPEPLEKGLQDLERLCAATGLRLEGRSSLHVQGLLESLPACHDAMVKSLLQQQAAKSMQLAEYFSTGTLEEHMWGHYALAMSHYTHFTSPIRRYADIVVHRLLQAAIAGVGVGEGGGADAGVRAGVEAPGGAAGGGLWEEPLWDSVRVARQAELCNAMKLQAKAAQEASTTLFLQVYLAKNPIECAEAVVTSLGAFSFTVYLPSLALDLKLNDSMLTVKPTWTTPNRANAVGGCISFEWDAAKMRAREGRGGARGDKTRKGEKVVMQVKMLTRVKLRVFVDTSSLPWKISAQIHAPPAAHALVGA